MDANDIGIYQTTVSGTCGTEVSDSVYVYVKKTEYSSEPEVFLWPTITSEEFNIALSTNENYNIFLFNSMGNVIKEVSDCRYQTTINVSAYAAGVYIIKVFNNNFSRSLRMIKK
jgi:hypothetical protein